MVKIVTAEEMRQLEQQCLKIGLTTSALMENAGRAVAEEVGRILGNGGGHNILILIGPGNNGGDGLVAGRHLHDWGDRVSLYLCGPRPADDPNLKLVLERGLACIDASQDENQHKLDELLSSTEAVIDALFGTGQSRPLGNPYSRVLGRVTKAKEERPELRVIALDLPSGLNADSGAVDPACLYADNTVTLGFAKMGLFSPPGAERAGQIAIADIGIPAHLARSVATELISGQWAQPLLPRRPLGAHKGSFGRVLVVAGSVNYIGAAYLACSGAMRVGAGLVTLATPTSLQPVLASKLTEVTYLPLPEAEPGIVSAGAARRVLSELENYDVLMLGCGLGQSESAKSFIKAVLFGLGSSSPPLVLDADALNTLAQTPDWWHRLTVDAILTPHPGEMSRLAGLSADKIQKDRVGIARKSALKWRKTVVLKGAYTVVAAPDGSCRLSPTANPGLASAGTGDVLAGAISGLLAQGLTLFDAAALGVYLHAEAGNMVKASLGDAGMMASDLLPVLPLVIKQLKES